MRSSGGSRTPGAAAEEPSRCHAKTGSLFLRTRASTLSGYCSTRSGATVGFSFLVGGMPIGTARAIEDRFVARIAAR
jgi:D-alanyl-D-alanine carboxypeptidase